MKKLFSLFNIAAFAAVVSLTSCGDSKDDPKPAPTIDAYIGSAGTVTYTGAGPVTITYSANASEGISKIEAVTVAGAAGSQTTTPITGFPKTGSFTSSTTDNGNITYTFTGMDALQVKLTVTDKNGATASKTIDINKGGTSTGPDINSYTAVILGNQEDDDNGSYYSTTEDEVYTQAEALVNSGKIDFVHYFGATNAATIAAPDNAQAGELTASETLPTKNPTKFTVTTLTTAEFDAITKADIATKAGTPTASDATKLTTGKVVAFKTAAGKLGLFKVTNLTGSNTTAGAITLEVKVQK